MAASSTAFGNPADGKGPLPQGAEPYALKANPPPAAARARVGGKLDLGVRALNAFATCCKGQRMGIFSGSGVGKSTLMAMLARNTDADAIVIGAGRRTRPRSEGIHRRRSGRRRIARCVVVAATSDEPALVRRQAAYVAMAVAEQLRDQGLHVLLLMDSVTRFAMAQREVGLSAGEPPASKGYTPTVFAELPRLLERAGPGLRGRRRVPLPAFTVLVEGDDHNEPVADAVRGILDGHIVLERNIAERGRFPAINILEVGVARHAGLQQRGRTSTCRSVPARPLAVYDDMAELIRLGAYKAGTNTEVDVADQALSATRSLPVAEEGRERRRLPNAMPLLRRSWGRHPGRVRVMKRGDTLIRLRRFRVDELKRRHGDARWHEGRSSSASSPIWKTAWRANVSAPAIPTSAAWRSRPSCVPSKAAARICAPR